MTEMYTWISFFKELAHKLGEYRNRQPELVAILSHAGVHHGLKDMMEEGGERVELQVMDPFTFFAAFNKFFTVDRRAGVLAKIKEQMDLQAEVPTDFEGVPTSQPMGFWYFGYSYQRDPAQIDALWDMYKATLEHTVTADMLASMVSKEVLPSGKKKNFGVGVSSITQGMYWLDPEYYMPWDKKTREGIKAQYPDITYGKFPDDYLAALDVLRKEADGDPQFFAKLSSSGHYLVMDARSAELAEPSTSAGGSYTLRELFRSADEALPYFVTMRRILDLVGISDRSAPVIAVTFNRHHKLVRLRLNVYNASLYMLLGRKGRITQLGVSASEEANKKLPGHKGYIYRFDNSTEVAEYVFDGDDIDLTTEISDYIEKGTLLIGKVYRNYVSSPLRKYHRQPIADAIFDHSLIDELLDERFYQIAGETDVAAQETALSTISSPVAMPLNSILYGPPGTGKTYATRERALKIIDGLASTDVKQQQDRYRHLLDKGQVRFVTFHQSYAYENFVEGIRPRVQQSGALSYEVEAGILKQIAEKATQAWELSRSTYQQDPLNGLDRTKAKFWKCSLGQAGSDVDADVYPYCIENNLIAIAYGEESVDLTSAKTHEDVEKLTQGKVGNAAHVRYLRQLAIDMKVGDIVVVPSSVHTIRAIGRVVGPYRFDLDVPEGYCHTRPVEWLHKDVSIPVRLIYDGQLTQPAIKPLSPEKIVLHHPAQQQSTEPERFVLIIDEINRGNISNILGEAITLLEADKRLGQPNEITVQLPYSKVAFCLPPNLYIVGTMNTADRSIALVDMALRRRFVFEELMANMSLLPTNIDGIELSKLLTSINDRLELLLDRDHTIGHAYFMGCASVEDVSRVLVQKIIPLLQEYFYDDLERIGNVLNDHANKQQPIIIKETLSEMKLFGNDLDGIQDGARYRIPKSLSAEQIIGIYA